MKESRLVTFIGGFYVFGGFIVLLSLFFGGSAINIRFDLANIPDNIVKSVLSIVSICFGFLYLKRVKVGLLAVIIFSVIFFCISATLTTKYNSQPYIGNMIYSLFVIVVTICKRKEFTNSIKASVIK